MAGYVGNVPVPQSVREDQSFTATAGQTTFNTLGYTDGTRIKVTLNGVLLEGGGVDYTATNGSDVVLTSGAAADDIVRFETFNEVSLVNNISTTPTFKTSATLKNDTEEDIEGGRESTLIFSGEQSGGEISTLAEIEASHDGTADDEKGDLIFRTNDGNDGTSPTERLRINSAGDMLFSSGDPSLTIANTTHEDTEGGRESTIVFQGEQSGGEASTLAQIEAAHDGTSDDEKGDLIFRTNDGSDGASPTEAMRIDSGQNILIGKSDAETTISGSTPSVQITGAGVDSSLAVTRREANAYGPTLFLSKSINTTPNNYTIVQNNDSLGTIAFIGDDGTNLDTYGASISAEVDGTAGANDLPTRLKFSTTADGASTPTERWRITSDGHFKAMVNGYGIDFSATETGSPATVQNSLLDDYEEGTFNLEMVGYHGNPTTKLQIPSQYTKIGNTVHFWSYATGLNTTSYSGNMWFSGLPFSAPSPYAVGNLYFDGVATLSTSPFAWISGGIIYAYRHVTNANATAVMHNVVSSGGSVQIMGTYKV